MKIRTTLTKLLSALTLAPILTLYAAHAAQASDPVVTKPPTIKLNLQFADLWCPTGTVCQFYLVPGYNPTTGTLTLAVGNQGSVSSPSCSLRIKEYRGEEGGVGGPWTFHKDYWATIPAMTPGQQKAIAVQVVKWSGGFTSGGKPIKHPRRWNIKADANNQVLEVNKNNNGAMCYTYN